ncbi:hypothetical protein PFISCL1PPCAC_23915, partial [Pristionchus fissidentatus]
MRNSICILILLALTFSLCLRTFISMLIVVMVRPASTNATYDSNIVDDDLLDWPLTWKPLIFSAPLLGCLLALPLYFKFLNEVPKAWPIAVVLIFQSLLSLISPLVARISLVAFIVLRVILGLAEGCVMPALNTIAAAWFPLNERVFKVAIYTCGFQISFGGVQYLISFLSSIGVPWQFIFYGGGVIGLLFCIVWQLFTSDSPSESRFVGREEMKFINDHIPKTGTKPLSTPWSSILSSPVVIAHLLCMSGFYFAIGITSNLLPLYFSEELGMPITKSGVFTLVPFLMQIISKFVVGFIVDWRKKKGGLSHTVAAKICQTIGSIGSALALFALPFCHSNHTIAFIVLVVYGATFSLCVCGFYASMTMIAPRLTGSITSLVTFVGMVVCLLSMLVFSAFVWTSTSHKFFWLFGIAGVLQVIAGVAYLIWGTAEVQPWAISQEAPPSIVMRPLLD